MATINLYRDMQKALLGEQKKAKVQPFRTPTSMTKEQSAAHIMSKLLDAWKDKQAKEERVADTSQAMEMARAYNAPQAAYDPDKYGTDPRQILTGEKQLDAYQSSLGETPAPSAGIDRNTSLAIADPSLKGASPYEPGDEPVGDVAGLEVQKQNLINDAVRQQGSFQKENPIGMARGDQDFGGDVEKGPVSQRMLLALMGREDENKRADSDRVNALQDKMKLKAAPGAPNSSTGRPSSPIQNFAERQRLVGLYGEKSPEVKRFDDYVRSTKIMNLGGTMAAFNPANPSQPTAQIPVTLKPGEQPNVRRAQAEAVIRGRDTGEAIAKLAGSEAALPRLESAITQLKKLGETATYTYAGQARDAITRQFAGEAREGAKSRAAYIAHVKNNVLPLLRLTFGAAFTVAEGDSLLATLGDPNASPGEKNAVLDAFISDKKAEIGTLRRHAGPAVPASKPKTMRFDAQGNLIP